MARLQILELPERAGDSRPPFVLVVDEVVPQRVILGMGRDAVPDYWQEVAERIGARGVIVTPETVEIPSRLLPLGEAFEAVADDESDTARQVRRLEGKLKEFAEAHYRENLDRMDAITDALGFDRLRDWDEIVSAIKRQQQSVVDGGHRFVAVPARDGALRCSICGITRIEWSIRRDVPTCNEVRAAKGGK